MDGAELSQIDSWIFDLDNTLYPASANLHAQMSKRIGEYVAKALDLPMNDARAVQKEFFLKHGTTLSGMMAEHGTDPNDYLAYVHDFPLDGLSDAPQLRERIAALPGRKIIFTNADAPYAARILEALKLHGIFEAIIDIHLIGYRPKPDSHAYETLLAETGIKPERSIFFEDQTRNLLPAKKLGMTTVWINGKIGFGAPDRGADHVDHITDDLATFLDRAIETLTTQNA